MKSETSYVPQFVPEKQTKAAEHYCKLLQDQYGFKRPFEVTHIHNTAMSLWEVRDIKNDQISMALIFLRDKKTAKAGKRELAIVDFYTWQAIHGYFDTNEYINIREL